MPTVALPVGTNRRLVVGFGGKYFNTGVSAGPLSATPAVPALTYNGVQLQSFTRATDGVTGAFRDQDVPNFFSRSNVTFLGLREADLLGMPASGPLAATFAPVATNFAFAFGYWFFGNCDQGERIRYFGRFGQSTGGTSFSGILNASGGVSDAVITAGINGASAGSIQLTIDAAPLTENFDTSLSLMTARFAGAHVLSTILGTTAWGMTYTAATLAHQATELVGLRLAEFFSPTPGAACVATDDPFGDCVVTESTPHSVSLIAP